MTCYYHKEFENKEVNIPEGHEPMGFCNEEEHTKWADKYYGKGNSKTRKYKTIEEIQERAKEIIAEKRAKRLEARIWQNR